MSKRTKRLKLLEDFRSGEYTLTEINHQLEKLEAETIETEIAEAFKRGFTAGGTYMLVGGPKDLGSAEEKSDENV